eukprot:1158659-Pelagomonas_calceolata.AAC.3
MCHRGGCNVCVAHTGPRSIIAAITDAGFSAEPAGPDTEGRTATDANAQVLAAACRSPASCHCHCWSKEWVQKMGSKESKNGIQRMGPKNGLG